MKFIEENEYYQIDCSKALWASEEHHKIYHDYTDSILSDVDWIIETNDKILLVEYKNGNVFPSNKPFNPCESKVMNNVAKKYYDTYHYINLLNKTKPIDYIFILEYPKDDSVTRNRLRNMISDKLPFRFQKDYSTKRIINDFYILSIEEWNKTYPDFPITRTEKPFSHCFL